VIPVNQIQALVPKARELCAGLSHDAFVWSPAPGAWSVAECLDHLNTTNRLYADAIRESIRRGRTDGMTATGPFRLGWFERKFAESLEPPVKFRFKAPSSFRPPPQRPMELVLAEWEALHNRLLDLATDAEGLHLTKVRMHSPGSRWLKVSLLGAFSVIPPHDRRHLCQAEQTLAARS
jgi:hypothetical protein